MSEVEAPRSLRQAAIHSTVWSLVGIGGGQTLRFLANVAFAYLLYEEAFALMMLVNVVVQGLQMFSDIGVGPSVIQHPRGDDPRFLGTAFTMQVARAALLAVLCLLLTSPVAAAYAANDPAAWDLLRLLPLAALSVFASGFSSMRLVTASRHLALAHVVRLDLVSQVTAILTTLVWAWFDRDVVALLAGNLAGVSVKVVLSHLVLPGPRDRFAWDSEAARSIFRFGGWILVSTAMSFAAMQVDRLVFAGAFRFAEAGVYHMAVSIAAMLPMIVGALQLAVVFPLYSRIENSGEPIHPALLRIKGAVLAVSGVLVAGLVAGGTFFVDVVYDERWVDAGWMLSLLAIGGWFAVLESLYGAAMLARGKVQLVALSNAGKPIVFLAIYFVAGERLGVPGFVLTTVAADVVRGLISMWGAAQLGVLTPRLDLVATSRTFVVGGLAWYVGHAMGERFGLPSWILLLLVAAMVLACHVTTLVHSVGVLRQARQ